MQLQVDDLGVSYDNVSVFDHVNFSVQDDDWLTITGESGSGKSTLLRVIAGLLDADRGIVKLEGKPQWDYDISEYRQEVSYAVQSAQLFGQTVRDNLNLPFDVRNQKPDEQRQLTLLRAMELPEDFIDKNVHELSGGQRQRVGVARNLLFPPKVLLLDEISTGLDEDTKHTIWSLIQSMQTKYHFAVLSVTHDGDEIKHANQLMRLENGKAEVYEYAN
ncbi:putative ABC transport system ATP-binding protein [Weissella uvarum]|uniref:ABC transporter ATP-binding protein n=1 Tax=Weissella uvarum TaxID=1479233 RepID=UPI001EF92724|nr:ATP-binding cassette domain-containing protein [Weissella uvarum]MBM7617020.1 putative ABC transport system ATP-binding protein [Weissella uvarum]